MSRLRVFVMLGALLLAQQAAAAPARYICPSELPSSSLKVEKPPPGWKPFVGSPLYLSDAAPADGPPERLGILRGEDGGKGKATWSHKYSLQGTYPDGKWLRCDYGAYGEISLAMRLPDHTQECTVKGRKGRHAGENEFEIICK